MSALSSASWDRVAQAFHEALDIEPSSRDEFLQRQLGGDPQELAEVRSMLTAHARESPLAVESWLSAAQSGRDEESSGVAGDVSPDGEGGAHDLGDLPQGTRVDAYRIVERIGSGGMGEVYLAERVDGAFERSVALKVVRGEVTSRALVRRFHLERQLLARLVHPDIVGIVDGGTLADGRPFLVMDRVAGVPITSYCRSRQLSLDSVLRLFVRIARAVHYAHSRLVVHRDLKPSNILVTDDGEPRLLDFGIARLLGSETGATDVGDATSAGHAATVGDTGIGLLTPEHAAPEQLRGEAATTATDVFGLGILLYLLLTGRRPHHAAEGTPSELQRSVLEHDAPLASSVDSQRPWRSALPGDLDSIAARALRRRPEERYASVAALADDLERYLALRPVEARAGGAWYRLGRFARRNRSWVTAASLALVGAGALVANIVVEGRRATRERDAAREARATSESVIALLTRVFERSNPALHPGGDTLRAEALVQEASRQVDALTDQPALQARMWRVIGNMEFARGRLVSARTMLRRSYDGQMSMAGSDSADVIRTAHEIARVTSAFDGSDVARPLLYASYERLRRTLGDTSGDVLRALVDVVQSTSDPAVRADRMEEVLRLLGRVRDADSLQTASLLNQLGAEGLNREDGTESARYFEASLDILSRSLPPDHANRLTVAGNLAVAYAKTGEAARAESLQRWLIATRRRTNPSDSSGWANALEALGAMQVERGDVASGVRSFRDALALERAVLSPTHWRIDNTLRNVGIADAILGRIDEGTAHLDSAIGRASRRTGPRSPEVAYLEAQRALVQLRRDTADARAALDVFAATHGTLSAVLPASHSRMADVEMWQGIAWLALARPDSALGRFRSAFMRKEGTKARMDKLGTAEACGIGVAMRLLGEAAQSREWIDRACAVHVTRGTAHPVLVRLARAAPP